ncbi:octopamine receptor 1 [Schistocerca piceifrons]|uniref:octopamine receptor 1 n=1 Tax=Schistocerca piceifrons TaxID=274613 RepID=UPI001F5E7F4E|nr:octopamine receptor 1 [Schistocerca piceifrons]XP_049778946.1 octopamine receptor 1 [Schistocerca cancellata]XP_049859076.1 octopamine receptor 1-like [Schistocerca gregaria]
MSGLFNETFSGNYSTDTEDEILFGLPERVIWATIDGALMIPILAGNIVTICAILWCRRLSSVLSNQFILNLAISDLLVGLFLPYHMAFSIIDELNKFKNTCLLRFILVILPASSSIYNLIAIAIDRYISIVYPLHYSTYMTARKALVIVGVGWILSAIVSTMPSYWNKYSEDKDCLVDNVLPKAYIICIITPAFVLVLVAMLVLYWRIWKEASEQARRLRNVTNSQSDWKSVQVVLLVLGSFSICWLPYFTVICCRVAGAKSYTSFVVYKAAFSMGMANSCINPLIYAWKNTEFKNAFRNILHCKSPNRADHLLETITTHTELHTIDSSCGGFT